MAIIEATVVRMVCDDPKHDDTMPKFSHFAGKDRDAAAADAKKGGWLFIRERDESMRLVDTHICPHCQRRA